MNRRPEHCFVSLKGTVGKKKISCPSHQAMSNSARADQRSWAEKGNQELDFVENLPDWSLQN